MNEITKELLDALRDAEEALSHVENNLHVCVNPPTLGRMREAIDKAEAALAAPRSDDGWIPWEGGRRPVGSEVVVTARFRFGERITSPAKALRWFHAYDEEDIIAYRVVKP